MSLIREALPITQGVFTLDPVYTAYVAHIAAVLEYERVLLDRERRCAVRQEPKSLLQALQRAVTSERDGLREYQDELNAAFEQVRASASAYAESVQEGVSIADAAPQAGAILEGVLRLLPQGVLVSSLSVWWRNTFVGHDLHRWLEDFAARGICSVRNGAVVYTAEHGRA